MSKTNTINQNSSFELRFNHATGLFSFKELNFTFEDAICLCRFIPQMAFKIAEENPEKYGWMIGKNFSGNSIGSVGKEASHEA